MINIINLMLISCLAIGTGFVQADSGESNSNLSIEKGTSVVSVFSDPEELVSALIKKAVDFENLRTQDDFLVQLGSYFDLSAMARFVLGRTVKKIDTAQLEEFTVLFVKSQVLSLLPHIKNLDSIELLRKRSDENKTVLIFNYMGENNKPIEIGVYIRKDSKGAVKIYDARIEGIRILMSWRSEFRSLIRRKGFEGMMSVLRDKLDN